MAGQRLLILTAGMGAGHNQVARELARRWQAAGEQTRVVDLLSVLPWRTGRLLRGGYGSMLERAPWLYDGIYRVFLAPHDHWQPGIGPLSWLIGRALGPIVRDFRPSAVVSTIHIAGQAAARLRRSRELRCPAIVVITEAVPHALWLAPGTDLYCGMFPEVARIAGAGTGADAIAPGPVVSSHPLRPPQPGPGHPGADALLIAGSWGVGSIGGVAAELARLPGIRPVVLCGRNEALREALAARPGVVPLGWREDVPALLRSAAVVIDNAGGSMCMEALAARVPVIEYRPIPGHGGPVVEMLARQRSS